MLFIHQSPELGDRDTWQGPTDAGKKVWPGKQKFWSSRKEQTENREQQRTKQEIGKGSALGRKKEQSISTRNLHNKCSYNVIASVGESWAPQPKHPYVFKSVFRMHNLTLIHSSGHPGSPKVPWTLRDRDSEEQKTNETIFSSTCCKYKTIVCGSEIIASGICWYLFKLVFPAK